MLEDFEWLLLLAELQGDPLRVGYADDIQAAAWPALAAKLNNLDSPAAGAVRPPTMSRARFQVAILPALIRISALTDNQQRKWDRILSVIQSVEDVHLADHGVQALFSLGVADGVLTAEEAAGIGAQPVSRLHALLGRPCVVMPGELRDRLGA